MARDAATVLLELLEKVHDAKDVERMLEPQNLYWILQSVGMQADEIRTRLDDESPGELLLEALERQPDYQQLLTLCSTPVEGFDEERDPFGETSTFQKAASFVVVIAVTLPAMIMAGFFPLWDAVSVETWVVMATLGAAAGGAGYVHGRAPLWVGALGGALVAPGALVAIYAWTYDRSTVLKIEIAIAFVIGALPGGITYYVLFNKLRFRV